jgi:hypothetical protein
VQQAKSQQLKANSRINNLCAICVIREICVRKKEAELQKQPAHTEK